MHKPQRRESFVIQVIGSEEVLKFEQTPSQTRSRGPSFTKWNFFSMKLFTRFRKILMSFFFSVPSAGSSASASHYSSKRGSSCERYDPPKTSCSSYYSSYSHYNEAIADCIEFINRSAQEGILEARKSDVV